MKTISNTLATLTQDSYTSEELPPSSEPGKQTINKLPQFSSESCFPSFSSQTNKDFRSIQAWIN
jgi:hypothetical protein